ncbi:heteroglycan glucosidase 1 [Abeliophyllum distichum]|uniref:Heteroglycan glucosidase 1 n=1 Tax=Abeliophyllum distichum TaxID=126358 RepID=A0ABD1P5W9_9LAMI
MVFAVKSPLPLLIVLAIVAVTVTSRLPRPRRLTRKPTNVKFPTRPLAPKAIRVKCPPRVLPVNAVSSLKGKFLLAGFLDVQSAENGHSFGGLSDATPKLFGRWMGVGALFPFCRGHSETDTIDHEPWSFREECEEVCRLALRRRHWLLPHLYNLFYLAHTRDPKDFDLRTHENSFLLGPLLVYASTRNDDQELYQIQHKLPKGMWLSFDFEDSHPDLPSLYLKGGSIIPLAPPYQHVDEANPTDDISLLVALDEHVELQVMLTAESANKGSELSRTPVEIKNGDWALKVVPWMGGRIISMEHLPSEEYSVIELVCLRVHPMFQLLHPTESHVSFTSTKGSKHGLAQKLLPSHWTRPDCITRLFLQ